MSRKSATQNTEVAYSFWRRLPGQAQHRERRLIHILWGQHFCIQPKEDNSRKVEMVVLLGTLFYIDVLEKSYGGDPSKMPYVFN